MNTASASLKICMSSRIEDKVGPRIAAVVPGCEIVCLEADGTFRGEPEGLEILLLSSDLLEPATATALPRLLGAPSLRWLQSPGAGVDHPVFPSLLERGVRVTSAAGIHAEPIAQYILAYVLHWERRIAQHLAQEAAREWKVLVSDDLTAKTLGIVGLGGIGRAAARAAKAFGMRVIATKRTPAADENVDEILPPKRLDELLAASHYVALTVPLLDETFHLIGRAELDAMRGDGVLINVARGKVVDEGALIEALREGRIKGATLDVTEEEPLPVDSPLWVLANS